MDPEQQLAFLLHASPPSAWHTPEAKRLLAPRWADTEERERIKALYAECFGSPKGLDAAMQAYGARTRTGTGTPTRQKAVRITARAILAQAPAPLTYVVDDILPAGCTIFTGKSKDGKSLAAYDLAVAVASGGTAFGRYTVTPGSVWYLALEDGHRRAYDRLTLMQERAETSLSEAAQDKLAFSLWKAPRLGEGLEEDILEWIDTTPDARLLIIDILEKVRQPRKLHGNGYAQDYEPTSTLAELAQERNIAILVIHHANKLNPEDFRDSMSGCTSLLGGADTGWSLRRLPMSEEATLSITGRDVKEQTLAMQFKDGYWTALGESRFVALSQEREAITSLLKTSPHALSPTAIAQALKQPCGNIKVLLRKMLDAKILYQPIPGRYALTTAYLSSTDYPGYPDYRGYPDYPGYPSAQVLEKEGGSDNDGGEAAVAAPDTVIDGNRRVTAAENSTSPCDTETSGKTVTGLPGLPGLSPSAPDGAGDAGDAGDGRDAQPCSHAQVSLAGRCQACGALVPLAGAPVPCRHVWEVQGRLSSCPQCGAQHPIVTKGRM